jgi:hypothetical protein
VVAAPVRDGAAIEAAAASFGQSPVDAAAPIERDGEDCPPPLGHVPAIRARAAIRHPTQLSHHVSPASSVD